MTAIVGLVDGNRVIMGADSCGSTASYRGTRADPKIFKHRHWLVGFCGSYRMGDILRYHVNWPAPIISMDVRAVVVRSVVPAVREALKEHGWLKKEHERESAGSFLVATGNRLFAIDPDLQVGEVSSGEDATGSGMYYALGSLYATRKTKLKARARVRAALEAAAEYDPYVRGPMKLMEVRGW